MKFKWSALKELISAYEQPQGIFLSLITEEGKIICANSKMIKTLHLQHPRESATNFFDLLHPDNLLDFKTAIRAATAGRNPAAMEISMKNGYYHPMNWEVNYLQPGKGKTNSYLCVGHKSGGNESIKKSTQLVEMNYQVIVESLNTGVLFQNNNGEIIVANKKAAEMLDTTQEILSQHKDIALLWNTIWTFNTEKGHLCPFTQAPFIKALQTGIQQVEILVLKTKNKEYRWLQFSAKPLFEDNNVVPYAVITDIIDISRERTISLKIPQWESIFTDFLKKTPNITWIVDEKTNLVFANQIFFNYFGLNEQNSLNKCIVDLVPAFVSKALYEKHIEVLKTGKSIEFSKVVKLADGTNNTFQITIFLIDGLLGQKMIAGYAVKMVVNYAVEKQLREANDRLLLLTRATSDAIWEWDMQTGTIFRNDVLMDMIGYHLEAPKGLSWWFRRIHPEDRNRLSDKVKETTEKKLQSWEDDYRFKCADGNYKYMHDNGFVVYENGFPVKMIGSLQDVSGLKEMKDQLLEEKLSRQKEISETVIKVQENERTRIGLELHDNVNQILSIVKLFVERLTPVNSEEIDIKKKSLDYILLAINEIRKLSKDLVAPRLNENGLIESIDTLIDDIHLSTLVNIKFNHDDEFNLLAPGKKVTLFRIVQEQLKNILQHSKASLINISLHCLEKNVHLSIQDNGIGFDSLQTQRGIGLSNIYERARFYSGEVNIQTTPGKGCTVTLVMPIL